jgi:sporulation protein YtfJ
MEKNHPIHDLMGTTLQKIREMVDANTIVGAPIQAGEVTLIPVSKLSFGFASGGSDFNTKNQKPEQDNCFGGGGGAGVNIIPVAFLVIKGESVRLIPMAPPANTTADRLVELVPEVLEKVSDFIERRKEDKESF